MIDHLRGSHSPNFEEKENIMTESEKSKATILAIDDSSMILNFLKGFLKKDFNVVAYSSTAEALEDIAVCAISPDCILSDYYLPSDLSGLEFLHRLKQIDPQIPLLFLSGSCDVDQTIKCLNRGAFDFIKKPFNPKELVARLNKAINSKGSKNYRYAV